MPHRAAPFPQSNSNHWGFSPHRVCKLCQPDGLKGNQETLGALSLGHLAQLGLTGLVGSQLPFSPPAGISFWNYQNEYLIFLQWNRFQISVSLRILKFLVFVPKLEPNQIFRNICETELQFSTQHWLRSTASVLAAWESVRKLGFQPDFRCSP